MKMNESEKEGKRMKKYKRNEIEKVKEKAKEYSGMKVKEDK